MPRNSLHAPHRVRRLYRAAGAALLLAVAAALLLLPAGTRFARADNGYTDITGNPLQVHLRFPDKETGSLIELPIPVAQLSPQAQQLLTTPLNQWLDQYWSGTPDGNGKTVRDRSCDTAKDATAKAIHDATGQTAHDISCNFATTGALGAKVAGSELVLSYQLAGNAVSFYVTTPDACVLGVCVGLPAGADPKFSVTFDTELVIAIDIPTEPCKLTGKGAAVFTHNASIDSGNLSGDLIKDANSIVTFVGGAGIFPPAQDRINREVQPIKVDLSGYLGQLSGGCDMARSQGFRQFDTVVDADRSTLTFRLSHPLDDAPTLRDPTTDPNAVASLYSPTIGAGQSQVKAGGQLALTGSYFHGSQTTHLHIDWYDGSQAGQPKESQVEWGPLGAPVTHDGKPRQYYDTENFFDANNLRPNTTYQFRVRNCDQVTCSPWSAWLVMKTAAQGSDVVAVYLDATTTANKISSATVLPDGTFSTSVTIPSTTAPGQHSLSAVVSAASQVALSASSAALIPANITTAPAANVPGSNGSNTAPTSGLVAPGAGLPATTATGSNSSSTALVNPSNIGLVQPGANDQVASTTITVLSGTQAAQPTITIIDPTTNAVLQSVVEFYTFTLRGEGFAPGQVTVSLDSVGGQLIGTTTAGSDGAFVAQFRMPASVSGPHILVANQVASGQTIQAKVSVRIQALPR